MALPIEEALTRFRPGDLTVKVCQGILGVLPTAPPFVLYGDVIGAVQRVTGSLDAALIARAETLAKGREVDSARWVADALDKADAGLAIYTGVRSLFGLLRRGGLRTIEADPQQALDAGLKLLGLAYIASRTFSTLPIGDRVERFLDLPAGREMLLYYAAAEVALPFSDNLVEGATDLVDKLMRSMQGDATARFTSVAEVMGTEPLKDALTMAESLHGRLQQYVDQVRGSLGPMLDRLRGYLPAPLAVADSATGIAASGLDALPVWGFLGPRVVLEGCALRSHRGE